uniref:Uncharacterized protein n=1 Tax=Panagrolaimus sp. JU765 TaxID=591449 RepID=A0AC34Q453_9BILA
MKCHRKLIPEEKETRHNLYVPRPFSTGTRFLCFFIAIYEFLLTMTLLLITVLFWIPFFPNCLSTEVAHGLYQRPIRKFYFLFQLVTSHAVNHPYEGYETGLLAVRFLILTSFWLFEIAFLKFILMINEVFICRRTSILNYLICLSFAFGIFSMSPFIYRLDVLQIIKMPGCTIENYNRHEFIESLWAGIFFGTIFELGILLAIRVKFQDIFYSKHPLVDETQVG